MMSSGRVVTVTEGKFSSRGVIARLLMPKRILSFFADCLSPMYKIYIVLTAVVCGLCLSKRKLLGASA